ncbi:polymorphic toxin-type HINT domain-containing protein [Streptosporangium sp. NPDC000509]|uniref:polymorphic toxin-type HINT domain-containing protein n=1 Tax=Streptosporangium sp. NPDC000509 TaxID=3366186 RepID=UPI0036A174F1
MAVLVTALPGLLLFQAFPVSAATMQPSALFHGPPDTPDQLTGSAAGLPSLVSADATRTDLQMAKRAPKPPKDAVPLEKRHKFTNEPAKGGLKSPPPLPKRSGAEGAAAKDARDSSSPEKSSQVAALAAGPSVSDLSVSPSVSMQGGAVTSSLTPRLSARVTDSSGRTVGINVEIRHDPNLPTQGTGMIWSDGTGAGNASGSQVRIDVPSGKLSDGWTVQWRIQGWAASANGEAGPWSAWQTLQVNIAKPSVSNLSVTPSISVPGGAVTSSLTPSLSAKVTDPEGRTVGINVEIRHDPNLPEQGTGAIWSAGTGAGNASGSQVRIDVPSGKLSDGWTVQWRIRGWAAATGSPAGAWSAWQTLQVSISRPSVSNLSVTPSTTSSEWTTTSSLTPSLSAKVTDPDGRTVGVNVEIRHDPALPEQGNGLIWSGGTNASAASGSQVRIDVPSEKLSDGWTVQWRIRGWAAATGSPTGPWSAWQTLKTEVLLWQWASPEDNTQVGSLKPTLSAYAKPGDPTWAVSYWFQLCKGTPENWDWCEASGGWDQSWSWQVPAGKLKWGETYSWYVQASSGSMSVTSPWRTFTTSPGQGTINSLLASGTNGRDFDHVSGNYTQSVTDATVASAGLPLSVSRTYNSLDPRTDGAFGAGWSTRWDMRVLPEPQTATLLVTYPDGRQVRFAAKSDGTYAPPPGVYATMADVTGGGWRLMDKSSTSYWFDTAGRLTKVSDRRDRIQNLIYGIDGKLSKVTAPGGRSLTFTWTGNHVSAVSTDPLNGAPLTWTYSYNGDALTKVCAPGAGTACTVYAYTTASRYRSVIANAAPTGYWRLGDAVTKLGDKVVSSADWNIDDEDAILAGASYNVTKTSPGALAGSGNGAMRFAGTANSTYVQLPSGAINGRGELLSVEAWFKTTGSGTIIGYQNSIQSNFTPAVYVGTDGKLRGQFRTATTTPITSTATVNNGVWHHVVLTGAENTQTLFLDGQIVGTLNGDITHLDQGEARVGYGHASPAWPSTVTTARAFPFTGEIDEVAVYGKPLGLAEVQTHYAARLAQPQMTTATLPSGRTWATNTFDTDSGRLLTHTDNHGGTWKLDALTYARDYETDGGNASAVVTDPQNGTLTYVNDTQRNHRVVSETDQLNKINKYEYDNDGNLAKVTDRNDNVVELFYNERGNLTGQSTCRTANNCNTSYYSYYVNQDNLFDPRNDQRTVSRDARSSSATDDTYATTTTYNEFGETLKQTTPATPDFPNGRSTSTTYTDGTEPAIGGGTTPAGLNKSSKDAKGNETTYRYSAAGDLAEQTSPSGLITKFAHNALGRATSRTEVSAAHPTGVTTTFTYDALGRPLTQTAPGVKNEVTNVTHTIKTAYTYDADGNKLTETFSDLTGGDPARTITHTYDTKGRTETVTNPEGGVTHSTWDVTGALASTTDPVGTVLTYAYTKRGESASVTLKNWTGSPVAPQAARDVVLQALSYDPAGRLAGQVDAMGRKTSYTYFADNRLSEVVGDDVRLNGLTSLDDVVLQSNQYDPTGNLVRQVSGGGKVTVQSVYDAANRLTSTTFDPAALGRKTAFEYDAVGNVTKKTSTATGTTRTESVSYAHNVLNQVTRQTVENGAEDLVTTSVYDDRGLLSAATDPRGNASGATAADFTATMRYDLAGRLVEATSPQVTVEKNGTAATTGRSTVKYGYNSAGEQTHIVDAEGRTTTLVFDKAGRLTSTIGASYTPPGGSAITPTVNFGYDAAGQQTTVTDPRNHVTSTVYDALGRPVKVTEPGPSGPGGAWVGEYNLLGEQLAVIDPTGARNEATYDDLGRQITQTVIERTPTTAAHTTALTYDTASNLTKRVAPGNKTTTYTVNAAGEVTATIAPATPTTSAPASRTTTAAYDLMGRQTKVTDALGNATEVTYDLAGRKTSAKDLSGTGTVLRTVGFGYDPAGNPTSTTSAEGHTTQRTFDAAGRLTSLIEPVSATSSITSTFGYDASGARTRTTDGRNNATWTTYNTLGLVESVIEPATTPHPGAADRTWTNLYDASGNATATLQPGGVRLDRTFDHLDRMTAETGSGAAMATVNRAVTYDSAGRLTAIGDYSLEYNDRSLLTKVSKATNQVAAYAYDATGNLTQRVDPTGTATYTWDAVDRLDTASDPVTGRTWTYGYDNANRLTSKTSANPVGTQTYGYDSMDRLTSQTVKNNSGTELSKITYGWDKDDNLTTKTTTGTAGAGTNTYTHDRAGRLTSWTAPGGAVTAYEWDASGNRTKAGTDTFVYDQRNRLTSGAGVDYTYTPRGTLATETKAGVTRDLVFDAFDRMVSDGEATYGYDALDRMTSRTAGATQQRFTYSGLSNNLVTVADGANTTLAKYGRDPFGGLLSLQEGASPALAVMNDLHGDVVGTFSATALVDSVAYDPFGEVTHRTGTARTLGYQGEYTDPDTGKVNMHARWYQPGTGTFTSRDTATLNPDPSVQANRYTYANAGPLTNTDPSGHSSIPILGGGSHTGTSGISDWQSYDTSSYWDKYIDRDSSSWDFTPPEVIPGQPYYSWPDQPCCLVEMDWWFDEERGRNLGVTEKGKTAPKGYWDGTKDERALFDLLAESIDDQKALNRLWKKIKSLSSNAGPGGAPPQSRDGNGQRVQCKEMYSKKECKDFKDAAKKILLLQEFNKECSTLTIKTYAAKIDKCTNYLGYLGINASKIKASTGKAGLDAFLELITPLVGPTEWIVNLFFEDAMGCVEGDAISCVLMAANFAGPSGRVVSRIAKIGKIAPSAGKAFNKAAAACRRSSFLPGTKTLMADGSLKPIEEVRVGDKVLATDPETGETGARSVIALIASEGIKNLVQVTVDTDGAKGNKTGTVVATDNHPFWVTELQEWRTAGELRRGQWLRASTGTYVQVAGIAQWTVTDQRVHNLTVDDLSTYYVVTGNTNILVHNDNVVPNIIKDMLRQITTGTLKQRTNPDGTLDFYRGGNNRRTAWWEGAKIYGLPGNNKYRILEKDGKFAWVGPDKNGGHNYNKVMQLC